MMKLLIENWREYIDEANGEVSRRRGDYPSVRKAKRLKAMGKPDESSWVPAADDLSSLGKGIVEDDTDACGSNPYRNANGEFSSAGDAKVYTTGYAQDGKRAGCKKQSKWASSGGGKGSEADKKCGRNPETGQKYNIRCKDNEVLWEDYLNEDGMINIDKDELENIIIKIIDRTMEHETINEGNNPQQIKKFCNSNGYSSTEQFLYRQNQMVASSKGDLLKDKKK
jgi:hypothetical protein